MVVSQIFNNSNLLLRQRTEAEGEGKRRAEQERELERLRRILRENTGSHQEKDEVIAGKKLKIICYGSVSFWYGSGCGFSDPYLLLTDADPAPDLALFVRCQQKIMCGSVPDPFETGNAVVAFRSQRPPTQWNLRGGGRSSVE